VSGIINARVISLGRYGRTKVIEIGVPLKNVEEGLSSDILLRAAIEEA